MAAMAEKIAWVLAGFSILVHSILAAVDFFLLVPVADILIRPDGSQMDPHDMLPLEEVFIALVAFPFLIIVIGHLVAPPKSAALILGLVHFFYGGHQFVKRDRWDAILHPDTQLTTEFLLISHVVWVAIAAFIWKFSDEPSSKSKVS